MKIAAFKSRQGGQGMTEYIVIVAMVAIAAIAVYQYFGQTVRNQTAAITKELAGEDGTAERTAAATAATSGAAAADTRNTLEDYVNQKTK